MARLELHGTTVSPGIGVGRVYLVEDPAARMAGSKPGLVPADQVEAALALFEEARALAMEDLSRVQEITARELGIQDAAIYGAQVAVLQDPDALRDVRGLIQDQCYTPESAVLAVVEKFERLFHNLEGGEMKSWAADLRDPWFGVIRALQSGREQELQDESDGGVVLVGEELLPSLISRVARKRLVGVVAGRGGRYSHGAVVARALGVPTLTGVEQVHVRAQAGETAVLFADSGRLLLGVEAEEQSAAERLRAERQRVSEVLLKGAQRAARTRCGHPVEIMVNIESPRDLEMFDAAICDGVGLFRTEFAYMERPNFPSAQEQAELYRGVLSHFPGRPVVFRTLDVGNDKQLRYFTTPPEKNPALGWRGLRLGLEWRDLLLIQLQAIKQSADSGLACILLPMVTTVEEIHKVKELVASTLADDQAQVPFGVMIEVPAAAFGLREILPEVDFLSVGTNDLVQYLFAVDRDNPWVAELYQPYHPVHLRVLHRIAIDCAAAGKPVSVCGEMAGQPAGALFLVGAGFDRISVAPPAVAELKALLAEVDLADLRDLAVQAVTAASHAEASKILESAAAEAWSAVVRRAQSAAP